MIIGWYQFGRLKRSLRGVSDKEGYAPGPSGGGGSGQFRASGDR